MGTGTFSTRPPAASLGRRLGRAFLLLALMMVALGGIVILNLNRVTVDARRYMEESREARLADNLQNVLEVLQETAGDQPPGAARVRRRLARARQLLDELYLMPEGDPSLEEHQSTEEKIITRLRRQLDRLEAHGRREPLAEDELAALLEQIRALGETIAGETGGEAARAMDDMARRVRGLEWAVALVAAVAVAVLLFLFVYVHRAVVRPLRALRRGAHLFGRGRLEHRIHLATEDEIGELAQEFNRMADSLTRSHRELEEQVRQRTRQFIQAARLADLGTFAAGVAHEVNTPLASIASCAEGLERRVAVGRADRDEQIEYLRTIAREAYRAHEITARLLAFARRDAGPTEPVDLGMALREVARLLRHEFDKRGVALDARCEDDLPPVAANNSELGQVVLNLLKNALDAAPNGGRVGVRCRCLDEEVVLEVEDDGPGVPPEDVKRIFDPFFTTKEPGRGTGLGLSLVHSILETYGGRIEVRDAPAGGALFRVLLPALGEVGNPEAASA